MVLGFVVQDALVGLSYHLDHLYEKGEVEIRKDQISVVLIVLPIHE
jgi:hypothetical protein